MDQNFIVLSNNYETIIDSLLSNWYVAVFVLIVVLVSAIPPFREGVKTLFNMLKRKEREYRIEYADETITFDVKCKSKNFDIVKINAITHDMGVSAEYEWIKKYYPDFIVCMQTLRRERLKNGEELVFDQMEIVKDQKYHKSIWFDVSSFIDGAHVSFDGKIADYVESTIERIYGKKEGK